jgi:hypothetical protein
MIGAELWKIKKQKDRRVYERRVRRSRFGELLQEDGSRHAWHDISFFFFAKTFCHYTGKFIQCSTITGRIY